MVEELIQSGSFSTIVVDSVAALLPASEIAREAGDPQIGAQAKLMSNHLKRIASAASKQNVAVIFINQLRMKIGVMFGNPEASNPLVVMTRGLDIAWHPDVARMYIPQEWAGRLGHRCSA